MSRKPSKSEAHYRHGDRGPMEIRRCAYRRGACSRYIIAAISSDGGTECDQCAGISHHKVHRWSPDERAYRELLKLWSYGQPVDNWCDQW